MTITLPPKGKKVEKRYGQLSGSDPDKSLSSPSSFLESSDVHV